MRRWQSALLLQRGATGMLGQPWQAPGLLLSPSGSGTLPLLQKLLDLLLPVTQQMQINSMLAANRAGPLPGPQMGNASATPSSSLSQRLSSGQGPVSCPASPSICLTWSDGHSCEPLVLWSFPCAAHGEACQSTFSSQVPSTRIVCPAAGMRMAPSRCSHQQQPCCSRLHSRHAQVRLAYRAWLSHRGHSGSLSTARQPAQSADTRRHSLRALAAGQPL